MINEGDDYLSTHPTCEWSGTNTLGTLGLERLGRIFLRLTELRLVKALPRPSRSKVEGCGVRLHAASRTWCKLSLGYVNLDSEVENRK